MPAGGSLPKIQMFWHGSPLGRVHRLCLASFVAHGHAVRLYAYDDVGPVPPGVALADAADVLPRDRLFRHASTGSLAVFADWFRYRMLGREGGIWCDLDLVCLRPLDYAEPVLFGWLNEEWLNNAVLGVPAGHPLVEALASYCEFPNRWQPADPWPIRLRKLRRTLTHGSRRDRVRFGETGPKALTWTARHLGLLPRARPAGEFYPTHDRRWREIFDGTLSLADPRLADARTLHLSNELMRREPGVDSDARFADPDSAFEELCRRYLPGEAVEPRRPGPRRR